MAYVFRISASFIYIIIFHDAKTTTKKLAHYNIPISGVQKSVGSIIAHQTQMTGDVKKCAINSITPAPPGTVCFGNVNIRKAPEALSY